MEGINGMRGAKNDDDCTVQTNTKMTRIGNLQDRIASKTAMYGQKKQEKTNQSLPPPRTLIMDLL
jgi:hypothetical protein